ncbi:recombination regulator RecX [Streptosporangium sp. NPDC006013]|uniref:recombination regulator RecX n=1 Tax=Streptosporangium sp. NPDC006013 TaxID=3155596 RepID=UPI0033A785DC
MMMGADLGPPGEVGPRDWGAWPDEPQVGSPGRSGRGRGDGLPASEGEAAGPAGGEPRSRKGRGSRRGGRRSGGGSPGALPDGPVEESPARKGAGADPQAVARAICLRLLTMAPRTRAQLAEALRKREVPQEAADAVLERFSEVGLIDDEAFAAAWVSSRHAGRGLARKALASELRHRGVAEETVKDAMEQLDPEQEAETARGLVRRKLSSTRGLDPAVRTRRLAGMLARKGYGPGLAFRVIREVLEDDEAETAPFTEDSGYPLD